MTRHNWRSANTNCPSSTMKDLKPRPSTLALSTRQRSTAPGRMNIAVGEKPPLIAVGGATRRLAAAGAGIGIDREDLDALDHHQALAIIVRPRLHAGIRTIAPGHRPIDRIVDIPFDDEKAGEAAGDLIVRRAVRVRVIPVRARRMRLRGRAGAAAIAARRRADARTPLPRRARAARASRHAGRRRRLRGSAVTTRQNAKKRVVA